MNIDKNLEVAKQLLQWYTVEVQAMEEIEKSSGVCDELKDIARDNRRVAGNHAIEMGQLIDLLNERKGIFGEEVDV